MEAAPDRERKVSLLSSRVRRALQRFNGAALDRERKALRPDRWRRRRRSLQWSRPRSRAEGRKRCDIRYGRSRFNGAALDRERKDAATNEAFAQRVDASMEPPSIESGRRAPRTRTSSSPARFNGAALDRERKALVHTVQAALIPQSFNGAALDRERKGVWGRKNLGNIDPLQWSRPRSRAEGWTALSRSHDSSSRFNGAALDRERKVRLVAQHERQRVVASMEPPSIESGRFSQITFWPAAFTALQWSRPRSRAEGSA